jgi:hypothetical protein
MLLEESADDARLLPALFCSTQEHSRHHSQGIAHLLFR